MKRKQFRVLLHPHHSAANPGIREMYKGSSEVIMYSHVNTIEGTLMATSGTANIEIVEDGESRWIDYRNGGRI